MNKIQVSLNKFDLQGFVADIIRFHTEQGIGDPDPRCVISVVNERGFTPEWGDDIPDRDINAELVREGKKVFFPFSDVNVGEPIPCADGNLYGGSSGEEEDEEDDEDDDEYEEEDEFAFGMGDTDVVGFLLQVEGDTLVIQFGVHGPGLFCGQAPSVTILEDAAPFEIGMREYIKKFTAD